MAVATAMQAPGKIISLDGRLREMEDGAEEKREREPSVAIPLIYTQMLKGDARAAMFLAQVLFHQHSKKAVDGWFWHTLDQWEDELGFSDESESRCCKTLKAYGLQTKVKAVNHIPKKHYHVDEEFLQKLVDEYRHLREIRKCEKERQKTTLPAINRGESSTSGKSVNDGTSGFSVNHTSEEPVNGTSGKAEDLQGKEDIDLKTKAKRKRGDADASGADAPPPLTEKSSEYKLALYLREAITKFAATPRNLPAATIQGLRHWIDPPKGNGLRALLAEGEAKGELDKRKREIRQIIDWLPTARPFWQTRFVSPRNNPGKILLDQFPSLVIESQSSTIRQNAGRNTNGHQQRNTHPARETAPDYASERERYKRALAGEGV